MSMAENKVDRMTRKLGWYLRQIFPLTYRPRYRTEVASGVWEQHFVVWRMWLGRSFDIDDVVLARRGGADG